MLNIPIQSKPGGFYFFYNTLDPWLFSGLNPIGLCAKRLGMGL